MDSVQERLLPRSDLGWVDPRSRGARKRLGRARGEAFGVGELGRCQDGGPGGPRRSRTFVVGRQELIHRTRDSQYGPIAAPVTAPTEPPSRRSARQHVPTRQRQSFWRPLGRVRPGAPGVGHSDRPAQRHPCRIATLSSSLLLRGSCDHVGCPASRSMRPRICQNRRSVKWLSASWRTTYRACRIRRPPVLNSRCWRSTPWT